MRHSSAQITLDQYARILTDQRQKADVSPDRQARSLGFIRVLEVSWEG